MTEDVRIRPGVPADLPVLTEIYNHYIRTTAITFDIEPKTLEQRRDWFAQFAGRGPYRLFVAVRNGEPVGWVNSARYREKAAYATSIDTSIYLAPNMGGQGIGRRLYATLFDALKGEDLHRAYAGVTLPNEASVAVHRGAGFHPVGICREVGRKFGRYWDVQWFERPMP